MDGGEGGGEALGVRSEQLEQGGLIELVVAKAQVGATRIAAATA